jgi:hypothetical protein
MSLRQFIPPAFVLALFASVMLAFSSALQPLSLIAPVTYVLANLSASVITAAKKGPNHLLVLPVIFAILHLSYGLGFLVGMAKFANRWGDRRGKVPDWPREHTTP